MVRQILAGCACTAVMLGLGAANASAGTGNVVQVVKAEEKALTANPELKQLNSLHVTNAAQAKAAIPKVRAVAKLLDGAAAKVSAASATTATQRTGKADWITAAHEEATGVNQLASGLQDLVNGNKTLAQATVKKALVTVKAGDVKGAQADKLLGL